MKAASCCERASRLGERQWQHAGRAAEAHRRLCHHLPSLRADLDRSPAVIGEIEIDAPCMLGDPDMDRPLRAFELRPCLQQIERTTKRRSARCIPGCLVIETPQPGAAARAADRPSLAVPVDREDRHRLFRSRCGTARRWLAMRRAVMDQRQLACLQTGGVPRCDSRRLAWQRWCGWNGLLRSPGLLPELARRFDRIDAGVLPPGRLVADAVDQPMVDAAERDRELVARLAAERRAAAGAADDAGPMACGRRSGRAAWRRGEGARGRGSGAAQEWRARSCRCRSAWRHRDLPVALSSASLAGPADCGVGADSDISVVRRVIGGRPGGEPLFERVRHHLRIIGGEPVLGGERCLCPVRLRSPCDGSW